MNADSALALQRATVVKVAWRVLPLIVVSYLVAYIDRSNVAFAALTMNKDLGFSAYLYGWGLALKGWQWVFVGEAVPAVVLGVLVLRLLTDRPVLATWLQPEQREWLEAELQAECAQVQRSGRLGIFQALTDTRVLILAIVWMLSLVPTYGITFFMPQVVKALGPTNSVAGILTAIPYAIGVLGPIAMGLSSDRFGERRWHYIGMMALAAVALACAGASVASYWVVLALSVAALGIYGSKPCFWPMPSQFLTGVAAAAVAGNLDHHARGPA